MEACQGGLCSLEQCVSLSTFSLSGPQKREICQALNLYHYLKIGMRVMKIINTFFLAYFPYFEEIKVRFRDLNAVSVSPSPINF
jgi:hypothetical protein